MVERDDTFGFDLFVPTSEHLLAIGEPLVKSTVMPDEDEIDALAADIYMQWGEFPQGSNDWRSYL